MSSQFEDIFVVNLKINQYEGKQRTGPPIFAAMFSTYICIRIHKSISDGCILIKLLYIVHFMPLYVVYFRVAMFSTYKCIRNHKSISDLSIFGRHCSRRSVNSQNFLFISVLFRAPLLVTSPLPLLSCQCGPLRPPPFFPHCCLLRMEPYMYGVWCRLE